MADKLVGKAVTQGNLLLNFINNTTRKPENITVEKLKVRLVTLEDYWTRAMKNHMDLAEHESSLKDHAYFKENLMVDYEEAYTAARADTTERLAQLSGPAAALAANSGSNPFSSSLALPKLPLPTFSGKQVEWETFKERFSALVKNDPSISPVIKLHRLLSCLEGDAARRLQNLEIVGANFEVAWDTLVRRFDNKRVRLTSHLYRLMKMPAASKKSSGEITRLLDGVNEASRSLRLLGRPVEHWDDWFIALVESRLDPQTREDWAKSLERAPDFPTYQQLVDFLEDRARTLDTANTNDVSSTQKGTNFKPSANKSSKSVAAFHVASESPPEKTSGRGCALCSGHHFIGYCPNFLKLNRIGKAEAVQEKGLCYNCLRRGHAVSKCSSKSRCRNGSCNQRHHTLLHSEDLKTDKKENPPSHNTVGCTSQVSLSAPIVHEDARTKPRNITILGTARAILQSPDREDTGIDLRILVDPGSESSFLTERSAQALLLSRRKVSVSVTGVGGEISITSKAVIDAILRSPKDPKFCLNFSAFVLNKLTSMLPRETLQHESWSHLDGLELADPDFHQPGGIDCILGGDVYPALMLEGLRKGTPHEPLAQNTVLGWILTGPANAQPQHDASPPISCFTAATLTLSEELRRFWEIEEVKAKPILSEEEAACEAHFVATHRRNSSGRYVVRLPFSKSPNFPGSGRIALTRFLQLERRLQADPELREAYADFIKLYQSLGHMERVSDLDELNERVFYLPHHPVVKQDSKKKVFKRVVFNASQSAHNGVSLNDCLHTGQKLQTNIHDILTRWRFPRFVFTADIIKMFRQFLVDREDADWQRIYWRDHPDEAIKTMRLLTVTYGTASAPYLAIRILRQLAQDERASYPRGAEILEDNFYVDDALAGEDTLEASLEARDQLINILKSAGMQLGKWSANNPALMQNLESIDQTDRSFDEFDAISTLGLKWSPSHDSFFFKVRLTATLEALTKRAMLSEIARLFDPLGWLSPVTITAKILIQRLWLKGADWDQPVDDETESAWSSLRSQLPALEKLRIPRWFGYSGSSNWALHGFADASQHAYAAAIYIVVWSEDLAPTSTLMAAKTKVAPIKTVSIPRLELCAAVLLAKLIANLLPQLRSSPKTVCCWSDSQVTLAWIANHPSRWTTFVANRVSEIRTLVPDARWAHVKSAENPADVASRGVLPSSILDDDLWWHGPEWLTSTSEDWVSTETFHTDLEVREKTQRVFATRMQPGDGFESLILRSSSLSRLNRVVAFMLRWKNRAQNARTRRRLRSNTRHAREKREIMPLDAEEITAALNVIIRAVQLEHYPTELSRLSANKPLLLRSHLLRLRPFIDEDGILRIGGRLENADLPYEEKHPAILPIGSYLSELVIRDAHKRTLHGGPQLVLSHLQRKFWIPQARNRVRGLTRSCIRCIRFRGLPQQQLMAPLPADRVTPSRPFATTGLDYAGPFLVRTSKGRGQKAYKGYVALFVCMSTRAIHLEVVSDYSSPTFLLAFKRFASRRGLPHTVYSDNGTTFQGAESEIQRLFQATSDHTREIAAAVASDGVQWKFIPPRAPHFGGIWEAGVKAFKHHLRRVLGNATLTFEEFSTLSSQIEACLNSRPLSPLSSDPEDVSALTAGHFLIGAALTALPEPDRSDYSVSGGTRFQHLLQMRNHFWTRWQKEVLHQMQLRSKWLRPQATIAEGDLVLIMDDQQPPTKWPLARVQQCHPGTDGLTRVLTLKTATNTLLRPLVKLIKLPAGPSDIRNPTTRNVDQAEGTCHTAMAGGPKPKLSAASFGPFRSRRAAALAQLFRREKRED